VLLSIVSPTCSLKHTSGINCAQTMAIEWAWLWAHLLLTASSAPVSKLAIVPQPVNTSSEDHGHHHNIGDSLETKTAFTIVSFIGVSLLSGLIGVHPLVLLRGHDADASGSRIRHTDLKSFKSLSLCHYLVWALYVVSLAFVLSAAILVYHCSMRTKRAPGSNSASRKAA
jgi:hypothetical protein